MEFQDLKFLRDPFLAETWDGVISIATTSICDKEIYHHSLNLKESVPMRRLTKLPPGTKNGAKFSGTEVSLLTSETVDNLLAEIIYFLQKMLILRIPKVVIELVVDRGDSPGSRCENIIQAIQCVSTSPASNIDYLKSGLKDYVFKHGNRLDNICNSCFSSGECLKVGSGVACSTESNRNAGQVMEAVIIISESLESMSPSCLRLHSTKTEVLYFKDFVPCSISQSSLNALTSIDWKSYGLNLRSISDQNDDALLEWENLPPNFHIDIVLHHYHKQYPSACHILTCIKSLIRYFLHVIVTCNACSTCKCIS